MDNVKLFSAAMGGTIVDVNTDPEFEEFVNEICDKTLPEMLDYLKEKLPEPLLKLKIGTLLDLACNLGSYSGEELENLFAEDEDEPE